MKIKDAIATARALTPDAFGDEALFNWINQLEGQLASQVLLMAPAEVEQLHYTYPEDLETELLVAPPYDVHRIPESQSGRSQRRVQQVRQQHGHLQCGVRGVRLLVLPALRPGSGVHQRGGIERWVITAIPPITCLPMGWR